MHVAAWASHWTRAQSVQRMQTPILYRQLMLAPILSCLLLQQLDWTLWTPQGYFCPSDLWMSQTPNKAEKRCKVNCLRAKQTKSPQRWLTGKIFSQSTSIENEFVSPTRYSAESLFVQNLHFVLDSLQRSLFFGKDRNLELPLEVGVC